MKSTLSGMVPSFAFFFKKKRGYGLPSAQEKDFFYAMKKRLETLQTNFGISRQEAC
jgi:hypothetical protein